MFARIKALYEKTGNKLVVINAVKENFITVEDYKKITGEDFE